ncbi:MerR family transcriptional regulator [Frigoribacterium sp. MCBA15_019]|uniref:MerR family transcriptional regulator n=1 Tax=Frigoribacterium sp. MCBA15_019 TaxID=1898745 RepID=UPI0009F5DA09|nr:MerR family transcriptional regulator [Frigoribacterium sp. MCBA15_019]
MRIGELAAKTGASVRALRYYEQQGLLAPERNAAGQRTYSPQHAGIVSTIRDFLHAGFCSSVISTILPALSDPALSSDRLAAAVDAAEARLLSEKHAIEEEMKRLAALRSQWDLDPHPHVSVEGGPHDASHATEATPFDHRDRRLRRGGPVLP